MGRHKGKDRNRSISYSSNSKSSKCSQSSKKSCDSKHKKHNYCSSEELYKKLTDKRKKLQRRCPTYIYNYDFKNGTYIIDKPGYYELVDDVVFNPNPDNNYMPLPDDPKYQSLGYSFGFFAAIVIANGCKGSVYLNLCGHTISQSKAFALQQRFFAVIELADAPFIPHQGPGDFSNKITSGRNVIIRNGTLGRSSHHGIHGNFPENILLEKLTITDFEIGGVAINGSNSVIINKTTIHNSRIDVPVLATYSAGRFALLFANKLLVDYSNLLSPEQILELGVASFDLKSLMDITFDQVMATGATTVPLFENVSQLPDGNLAGVLFHPPGVAVDDFAYEGDIKSTNIFINRTDVKNLKNKVNEIIAISATIEGKGAQTDVAGAVLQIVEITDDNGLYKINPLSNLQILLAKISISIGIQLGKNSITQDTIDWSENGTHISTLLDKGYTYKCNGDSMFHVNKGIMGYRIDGVDNFQLTRSSCKELSNIGWLGNEVLCGAYEKSHDNQMQLGYSGDNSCGISLSWVKDVKLDKLSVDNNVSANGHSVALNIFNKSKEVCLDHLKIDVIKAGSYVEAESTWLWLGTAYDGTPLVEYNANYPNKVPNAVGIKVSRDSRNIWIGAHRIGELVAAGAEVPVWSN